MRQAKRLKHQQCECEMRKITFDSNDALYNAFGVQIPLKQEGSSFYALLPLHQSFSFGDKIFYTLKGFGDISYKELPMSYPDFSKIALANLDFYIQNKKHSSDCYDEMAQIESFVQLLEQNNSFDRPKIYTKEYNNLLNQLLGSKNERYFKI